MGGSIGASIKPSVRVFNDNRPNLRPQQNGFVAEARFIPRPYDRNFNV